jgi:AcrR family transcriptional regulator
VKATKVKNAYMKKKDTLFVRESLLNAAFELAATKGMADVTVNKVSELADVTILFAFIFSPAFLWD